MTPLTMTSAANNRRCGAASSIRTLPPSIILFYYCLLWMSSPLASVSSVPPFFQNNIVHSDDDVVLPSIDLDNSTTATFQINDATKNETTTDESTEQTEKMRKSRRRRANVATLNMYLLVKDEFDAHRTEIDDFVFQTLQEFSTDKSTTSANSNNINNPNSNKRTKPSRTYRYPEFFSALRTLATEGIYGNSYHEELHPYAPGISPKTPSVEILRSIDNLSFYVGQEEEDYVGNVGPGNAVEYGIVNICAFLAQAMVEGIQFDACEEWNGMGDETIGGDTDGSGNPIYGNNLGGVHERYFPVSNACGQFGIVYHQERCEVSYFSGSDSGVDMTCPFDTSLLVKGMPHPNQDYLQNELGVPPPLECRPKANGRDYAGYWDGYDGQFVEKLAYPSTSGKVDVQGCCYWGRGALRTNGLCNFGKINFLLGRGAYLRKRYSRYPTIDFCRDPGAVCSESSNTDDSEEVNTNEIKYIISLFEWIERIQSYSNSVSKWDYMEQLKIFVDEGFNDSGFIDAVSSVVTRGCDEYYCSTKAIYMMEQRRRNFEFLIHDIFGLGSSTQSQPRYDYDHFEKWVQSKRSRIEGTILISQNNYVQGLPYFSQSFTFDSFISALRVTARFGVSDGLFFYVGDPVSGERGFRAGVVNLAAFLANAMVESIVHDSCDETYWESSSDGKYPMSNSCGQNTRSYQDETCPVWQSFISCPVDDAMVVEGEIPVMGKPPFFFDDQAPQFQCRAGADYNVGYWDQSTATYIENEPYPNSSGRTDVEGCCWWGRGVLHTRGVCNFGKLNFHLGVRAANENRPSIYPDIDFCTNPEEICTNRNTMEIRWVVGMFEWINRVQDYYDSKSGFDYKSELLKYVDGGMLDDSFIENVNRIVVTGCHTSSCSSTLPTVDTDIVNFELQRKMNFKNMMKMIFNMQPSENRPTSKPTPPMPTPKPTPPVPTPNPTSPKPTVSVMTSPSPNVGVFDIGDPSESQRPTGSPVELSDITQLNKGGEIRVYNKASSISDETLIITRNTTLRIEGNGYIAAPINSTWPALRLSDSAKLIAISGYVNGSYAEGGYEGGGGEAIQLNNGQSTVETSSYAEFYDGINVIGGNAPGPDGIGGNALQVNGFGTEAMIYGGNFIPGKGGKFDGSSLYILNSGSVHIYGGNFFGEIEVTRNGIIQFHGCFLQNGTTVYGLFPDESELDITVRTTFGGQIVIIPDGEQECDTAPSSSPTRFPTISPQPTVVPRSSAQKRPRLPCILIIMGALSSFLLFNTEVTLL